jgi:AAA15 family ATPase/GTPase
MHIVSQIKVSNFKSICNHNFNLSSYTPLIGYNNAGKSNIVQALKWFIRPCSLNNSDFFDSNNNVEVIGVVEGITSNILNQLTSTNATKIKKYLHFDRLVFKRIQQTPNCSVKDIKLEVLDYGYGYVPDV